VRVGMVFACVFNGGESETAAFFMFMDLTVDDDGENAATGTGINDVVGGVTTDALDGDALDREADPDV
jgi:hypothetical protein